MIAFPQRDVHLDTLSPLKVELSSTPRSADGNDEAPVNEKNRDAD